mgnify:CR=1 FL=1
MEARYTRLYSDADGESHFEDIKTNLVATDFAPPAPPLNLSLFLPATQLAFLARLLGGRATGILLPGATCISSFPASGK